jgi:hypothetical protein
MPCPYTSACARQMGNAIVADVAGRTLSTTICRGTACRAPTRRPVHGKRGMQLLPMLQEECYLRPSVWGTACRAPTRRAPTCRPVHVAPYTPGPYTPCLCMATWFWDAGWLGIFCYKYCLLYLAGDRFRFGAVQYVDIPQSLQLWQKAHSTPMITPCCVALMKNICGTVKG